MNPWTTTNIHACSHTDTHSYQPNGRVKGLLWLTGAKQTERQIGQDRRQVDYTHPHTQPTESRGVIEGVYWAHNHPRRALHTHTHTHTSSRRHWPTLAKADTHTENTSWMLLQQKSDCAQSLYHAHTQ